MLFTSLSVYAHQLSMVIVYILYVSEEGMNNEKLLWPRFAPNTKSFEVFL